MNGRPPAIDEGDQPTDTLLLEASVKKEEYRQRLRHGTWMIEFTKVDGTPSVMEATLDSRYLPPEEAPQGEGTKAADNPTVLRVYAVDRGGWRSFKVLNVKRFYQLPENL